MYLSRLIIENYRSIKYLDIPFSKGKNLIVGKNNSGKSNITKALNLVLGEKYPTYVEIDENDFYTESGKAEPYFWILCELNGDDIDIESIKQCKGLWVGRLERQPIVNVNGKVKLLEDHLFFDPDHYYFGEREKKTYIKNASEKIAWADDIKHTKAYFLFYVNGEKDAQDKYISDLRLVYCRNSHWFISWGLSKQVRDAFLTSSIIDSFRDTSSQLRVKSYNWFGRLIKHIWDERKLLPIGESGETTEELLNRKFLEAQKLTDSIFSDAASEVMKAINMSFESADISFQMTVDNKADIHKGTQIFVDDGFKSHIGDKGSGIQSAIIINLFSYYCHKFHQNTSLLIIEEPELYLHPQARRALSDKLEEFINLKDEKENQIILTTHSSEFISAGSKLNGITIVRKENGSTQAKNYQFEGIETKELQTLLRNENSEMFFADKVILVEGAEKHLMPVIADMISGTRGILDKQNISVIRVGGKGEFNKYFKILKKYQIPCFILADRDYFFNGINRLIDELTVPLDEDLLAFASDVQRNSIRSYKKNPEIEKRIIRADQTLDAKALCEALEHMNPNDQGSVKQVIDMWTHIKPKVKKKDVEGYMQEQGSYQKFLDYRAQLWSSGVFILEKGELEDYQTNEGRQLQGGKEEKVINMIRAVNPDAAINLSHFLSLSEFKVFLEKVLAANNNGMCAAP